MKVLQVCNRVPLPPKDGGTIAVYNVARGLQSMGVDITIFALNTSRHFADVAEVNKQYPEIKLVTSPVDNRIKALDAFWNLFSDKSYNAVRFYNKEAEEKLKQLLQNENFDLIQLESIYPAVYLDTIREFSKAPVIMRAHNVEFRVWETQAAAESFYPRKKYLELLAKRLKVFETDLLNRFDAILPITKEDAEIFRNNGYNGKMQVLPVGFDLDQFEKNTVQRKARSIFHLGSMDWQPNQLAMDWFLDKVWPQVKKKYPDLTFELAGRNMPQKYFDLKIPGVKVWGETDDAAEFMKSREIMVVPLFSGSGMRVKIIEGMAAGNTILATPVAAQGINYSDGNEMLIANTEHDFVSRLSFCLEKPGISAEIGSNAKRFASEYFDNRNLSRSLVSLYQSLLT